MRFVLVTILCLVLGFITTVAVAWGLAASLPVRDWPMECTHKVMIEDGYYHGFFREYQSRGASWRSWYAMGHGIGGMSRNRNAKVKVKVLRQTEPSFAQRIAGSHWGSAEALMARTTISPNAETEYAVGWPALAGWYGVRDTGNAEVVDGGIELDVMVYVANPDNSRPPQPIILPFRPIQRGVAFNTAFYAVLWFVPLHAIGVIRRWRRRCRGLCVRCAYSLRGLTPDQPCPECGHGACSTACSA